MSVAWTDAVILGLVQGLTEFLPVSSSGHLALGRWLLGAQTEGGVTFEVAVHLATAAVIALVYRSELLPLLREVPPLLWPPAWRRGWTRPTFRLATAILVSAVPAGLVGVLAKDQVEEAFHNMRLVGLCLVATGAILVLAWRLPGRERGLGPVAALLIGGAQALAVLPGISRSGSTISAGLLLGLPRAQAARFAFLMALPPILGASFLELREGLEATGEAAPAVGPVPILIGMVAAGVSGWLALRLLLGLIDRGRLVWFAPYCAAVGLLALLFGG